MENPKDTAAAGENSNPNPNPNPNPLAAGDAASAPSRRRTRAPFTSLTQEDADLTLALALQDQERAYMMLRWNGGASANQEGSDYEDEEDVDVDGVDDPDAGDYEYESEGSDYGEDAFDAMDHVMDQALNPVDFGSDEAYAAALQQAEERELVAHMNHMMALAGLDVQGQNYVEDGNNYQDEWDGIDPDELSYEELTALGEIVGTASRGLSADTIASLPSINYKAKSLENGNTDQCVICRLDYEDEESLVVLSCKHMYHPECINKWLQINKVCPICSTEVPTSENKMG